MNLNFMLKLKSISLILPLFLLVASSQAQSFFYENETNSEGITFTFSSHGRFSPNVINPDTSGENTSATSATFVRQASVDKGFTFFELAKPIQTASPFTVSLKGYIDVKQEELAASPKHLSVFIKNASTGDFKNKQIDFTLGQKWENFSFVFDESDFTASGLGTGGYNQFYIAYGNGITSSTTITYFIDQIYGTTDQELIEETPNDTTDQELVDNTPLPLQGSWGVRLYIRGGETLDDYAGLVSDGGRGYEYVAGAQEILNSYPTIGHVITNATNNAKSFLWTLRTNENVEAVMGTSGAIVDEEFVPSLENEQVIIDVISEFKKADKKVFLYLNGMSPARRASPEGAQSWDEYVARYFSGNEHLAWMNFCEGYIKRFEKLGVDGYWIDAFGSYPGDDSERAEFIQMIRDVDSDVIIAANYDKDYFLDKNGDNLKVDTDGVNDIDEKNYSILKLKANEPWSDMIAGHITPLGHGAPPNSWAYEEFTIPDIQASPTTSYDGSKQTLKHIFLPMRSTWSNERSDLRFVDAEQAYRFVKNITDTGAAVTFSTTTDIDGTTMEDEEAVLKFVDQQLAANAPASQYLRPEGAFLVGELSPLYENEYITPTDYIAVENARQGAITEDFSNPFRIGSNVSKTVSKFVRNGGRQGRIYFNLPNSITDLSSFKISLDAFIDTDSLNNIDTLSSVDYRVRVYLQNSTSNTKIFNQQSLSSAKTWENLEFDFSDRDNYPDGYDQIYIGFAIGDDSGKTTTYYFDNIKGAFNQDSIATTANKQSSISSINSIAKNEPTFIEDSPSIKIYPNPVNNSFKLSCECTSVRIYSISGEQIANFSGNQSRFDVSNLTAGLYLIRAFDERGNSEVLKFVKR